MPITYCERRKRQTQFSSRPRATCIVQSNNVIDFTEWELSEYSLQSISMLILNKHWVLSLLLLLLLVVALILLLVPVKLAYLSKSVF